MKNLFGIGILIALFVSSSAIAAENYISLYFNFSKKVKSLPRDEQAAGWETVRAAAEEAGDPYYSYFAGIKLGHVHYAAGRVGAASENFERALRHALTEDGTSAGRFGRNRRSIALTLLHLRSCYLRSARMGMAETAQRRAEHFIDSWARDETGGKFDCLADAPPPGFPEDDRFLLLRICSTRAELLDLQGRTLEAVGLLKRSLAHYGDGVLRGNAHREFLRSTTNAAIMYDFLGYDRDALTAYSAVEKLANESRPRDRRSAAFATVNRLSTTAKIEGYSREIITQVEAAIEQIDSTNPSQQRSPGLIELLAKMEARLGETLRAKKLLEQMGEELAETDLEFLRLYSRRTLLIEIERRDGDQKEADFLDLLRGFRERGLLRSEPTTYREYSNFLARADRFDEAVTMVARAAKLSENFGWHLHLPPLWIRQAEWHDRLGQTAAADALWRRIDTLIAAEADFPAARLIMIAEERAVRSIRLGEPERATGQVIAARRLLQKLDLSPHEREVAEAALKLLAADILTPPPHIVPVAAAVARVDLQPLAARSEVAPGSTARTRFSLSNTTAATALGRLRASGPVLDSRWDEPALVWHITGGGTRSEILSPPLRCPAGARVMIELTTPAVAGDGDTITLSWLPETADGEQGGHRWEWRAGEPGELDAAMTTAHLARRNPFYMVPLFQEIHGADAGGPTQNFRIIASAPCRLEISDADGAPLAIDADGDGSFRGKGDVLSSDADADMSPDVPLAGAARIAGIEVALFADARSGHAPIRLEFQLPDADGHWQTFAVSIVE